MQFRLFEAEEWSETSKSAMAHVTCSIRFACAIGQAEVSLVVLVLAPVAFRASRVNPITLLFTFHPSLRKFHRRFEGNRGQGWSDLTLDVTLSSKEQGFSAAKSQAGHTQVPR